MATPGEHIQLQEVIDGRRKIRNGYLEAVWKFSAKAVRFSLLISIAMFLVAFLFRQDLPPSAYFVFAVVLVVGFVVMPTLVFGGFMARQYFWYHKELRALEKRIRAGEQVVRPNPALNTDARQDQPRAG